MRALAAILLSLLLIAPALGQASGTVERAGLDGYVRPNCWVPLRVRLKAETGTSQRLLLRVRQLDLDGDTVLFQREISLTGNLAGERREQDYWTYFKPEPVENGLASTADLQTLNKRLVVTVNALNGTEIARLPITNSLKPVDDNATRGRRLVVFVGGRNPQIGGYDYGPQALVGVSEDLTYARLTAADLPEDVRGYDAADGVVLFDADYDALAKGGRLEALREYVRRGGRLVICQPTDQYQAVAPVADLLPVSVTGVEDHRLPAAFVALAAPGSSRRDAYAADQWNGVSASFRLARATPTADARVDSAIDWPVPGGKPDKNGEVPAEHTPYVARRPFGAGGVTWVAQDLARLPAPNGADANGLGWAAVWSDLLGFDDEPIVNPSQRELGPWRSSSSMGRDLGQSLLADVNLTARTTGYVALAVIFFIGYWLIAGPGLHFVLVARKRAFQSWFWFGGVAIAATLLTVVVVRLVLRGPPEARHLTVLRVPVSTTAAPAGPALAMSRIGLYIPRNGAETVALTGAADGTSGVTAFAIEPAHLAQDPEKTAAVYAVPVRGAAATGAASVDFPYRSTLKKLQATWVGPTDRTLGLAGPPPALVPGTKGFLKGMIRNDSGRDLTNVYLAFRHPDYRPGGDPMIFRRAWLKGDVIDLGNLSAKGLLGLPSISRDVTPENRTQQAPMLVGSLSYDWTKFYWWPSLANRTFVAGDYSDYRDPVRRSYPILSLFDALPPMPNSGSGSDVQADRADLLRRGARGWDVSAALADGAMVVIAEADGPLPFGMTVDGAAVGGQGTTLYQFVVPLDRSALHARDLAPTPPPEQ